MSEVLLESVNPNGNVQAVVEAHDDVCYFYLFGAEDTEFGVRSVWVRNLAPAPAELEHERITRGEPPRNPAQYTNHPQGLEAPDADALRVVWLPEGSGAALYEHDDILAIIPPWSGNGFDGYARDALGEGPLAWQLSRDNVLLARFAEAEAYWALWDGDLWVPLRDALMARVEAQIGPHGNYYAIDGGDWPPKALLRIPRKDSVALVTVGVCVRPQPGAELHLDDPRPHRRIELGVILPAHWSDQAIKQFAGYISGQSRLPWEHYTWLGPGHTIPCDAWQSREFPAAVLSAQHPAVGALALGEHFSDPVNVLWFLPITAKERSAAEEGGVTGLDGSLPADRWRRA